MRLLKYVNLFEYDGRGFIYRQTDDTLFELPYLCFYYLKNSNIDSLKHSFFPVFSF